MIYPSLAQIINDQEKPLATYSTSQGVIFFLEGLRMV